MTDPNSILGKSEHEYLGWKIRITNTAAERIGCVHVAGGAYDEPLDPCRSHGVFLSDSQVCQ